MTCRFIANDQPRIITGRHTDDCYDDTCPGCQPCTQAHCRICNKTHTDGTCPECLDETRNYLHNIATKCGVLPTEAIHRGVHGEAMTLLGPTADPEARGHAEASYLAGRLPEGWIEANHGRDCPRDHNEPCVGCAGDENHPLYVLGDWDSKWRDALDHDDPDARLTLADAVDYLDRTMSYMADYEHVPFEDFHHDLRRCQNHLDAVLHDQNQGDKANVGCFDCGGDLERRLGKEGFEDFWTCDKCRRRYTYAEYNFALRAKLEDAQQESA